MKVKELIKQLKELDQEAEIRVSLREGWRPKDTKSIKEIDVVIDQDTNIGFYCIDINVELDYEKEQKKILIDSHKNIISKDKSSSVIY